MGCLIANGALSVARTTNSASLSFSSNDETVTQKYVEIVEALFGVDVKRVAPKNRCRSAAVYSSQLVDWFVANGLSMSTSAGKSIPDCVLRSSKNMHIAFLSGYLSCDSSIYQNFIDQITASATLHKQLAVMFMSLGCVATARTMEKAATNGSGIKRPYYGLTLVANNMRRLLDLVDVYKERPVNVGRNPVSRDYGDADNLPFSCGGDQRTAGSEETVLRWQAVSEQVRQSGT